MERGVRSRVGLLCVLALLAALRLPHSSEGASFFRHERLAYHAEQATDWLAAGRPARALVAIANGLGIIGSRRAIE